MTNYYFGEKDSLDWSIRVSANNLEKARAKLISEIAEGNGNGIKRAEKLAEEAKQYFPTEEEI